MSRQSKSSTTRSNGLIVYSSTSSSQPPRHSISLTQITPLPITSLPITSLPITSLPIPSLFHYIAPKTLQSNILPPHLPQLLRPIHSASTPAVLAHGSYLAPSSAKHRDVYFRRSSDRFYFAA